MKKKILSLILACVTLLTAIPAVGLSVFAATDTFTPVTRFVVISDIHVNKSSSGTYSGENVMQMMDRVYAYLEEKGDSVLPSAIITLGDNLNDGIPDEADHFAEVLTELKAEYKEKYGTNLPIYALMGNHEYNNGYFYSVAEKGDAASSNAKQNAYIHVPQDGLTLEEYFEANLNAFAADFIDRLWGTAADANGNGNVGAIDNSTLNWHYEIGGMHFIGISISTHLGNLSDETLNWLAQELAKAKADTPNSPIFLFGHHPKYGTLHDSRPVNGSDVQWSHYMPDNDVNNTRTQFEEIIADYPNVIFSTGHIHEAGNSPLAIWQEEGSYTAYGPGALTVDKSVGGDFAIVEIDANNTVRLYPQNINGAYTNPDGTPMYYEISYANGTHSYNYTDAVRENLTAEFADDQTAWASNIWASEGVVTGRLSFNQAKSGDVYAYTYDIEFDARAEGVASVYASVESGVFARVYPVLDEVCITSFILDEGQVYDVKITPVNRWGVKGETKTLLSGLKTPSSELKENGSNYTSIYAHPTSGTGVNDYTVTEDTLTFAPAWSIGAYSFADGEAYPYNVKKDNSIFYSEKKGEWTYGGMYTTNGWKRRIIIGTTTVSYITYTAEKSGTLNFTVDNVTLYAGAEDVGKVAYAVVKNFSTVLTANNYPFVAYSTAAESNPTWNLFETESLTLTVEGIKVQKGDTVSFVVALGTSAGNGICDIKMHADYTKELETVNYTHKNTFVQGASDATYPQADENNQVGTYSDNPVYALSQNPAWEMGSYYFGSGTYQGRNPFTAYQVKYNILNHRGRSGWSEWATGGAYAKNYLILPGNDDYCVYIAYVAETDGILDLDVTDMDFKNVGTAYAVVKNFKEVLTGELSSTFANWTEASSDAWLYSDMAGTPTGVGVSNISVKKGDTVAIVFDRGATDDGYGARNMQITVKYREEYVDEKITYEHKLGGSNYPVTENRSGTAIFAEGDSPYELGVYGMEEKKAYPYTHPTGSSGIVVSEKNKTSIWSYGGYYGGNGNMVLSKQSGYITYIAYIAEADGTIDFTVSDLAFQREGSAFTVVKNFKQVLVNGGGAFNAYTTQNTAAYWQHSEYGKTYTFTARDIDVKKGDVIAVVFEIGVSMTDSYNTVDDPNTVGNETKEKNRGPKAMSIDVQYRYTDRYPADKTTQASDSLSLIDKSEQATVDWSGSIWTPIVYGDRNDAGKKEEALVMNIYNAGQYSYSAYSTNADIVAHAFISTGKSGQRGPLGAMMISCNSAAGYRYIAEKSGNVKISFEQAGAKTTNATAAETVMGYAIFVNGVKVWPYGDSNWYNMRQEAGRTELYYTEQLNAAMPDTLFLAEGDCVEVLCRNDNGQTSGWANRGNIFLPQITYENEIRVSASLNDKFAITLHPVGELGSTTVTMNGKTLTVLPDGKGGYTVYGIAAREMGDTVTWTYAYAATAYDRGDGTVTVPHEAQTWTGSYADLMKAYIALYAEDVSEMGVAVTNLAVATLNYGTAAQIYFDYKTDELINASLTDAQKAMTTTGTYATVYENEKTEGATFKPYAVTLLLEDSISLKVIVNGTAGMDVGGYKMRFTCGGEDFLVDLVPCGEGGGSQYKGILRGLTPTQWNEAYEITVVDANGTAVSGTVTYSVSTYALRTADNAKTKAVTDKLLALYEMAVAYRSAQA